MINPIIGLDTTRLLSRFRHYYAEYAYKTVSKDNQHNSDVQRDTEDISTKKVPKYTGFNRDLLRGAHKKGSN